MASPAEVVRVENVAIIPPGGGLPETTLSLGTGYTVNAAAVGANIREGLDFSETLIFGTTVALAAAERAQLTLYVCDEPFLFSGGALDGKLTKWTDTRLDWSDHAERTLTISRDQAAPTFMSARLVGTTLTLTFNEDLGAAAALANTDFEVKKTPAGGTEADVILSGTPAISGRTVSLTLSSAVADTDTVTVFYTKLTGTADKLVDKFGNETATFDTAKAVDLVLETDPPVFGTAALAVDGRMLTLTYNEALKCSLDAGGDGVRGEGDASGRGRGDGPGRDGRRERGRQHGGADAGQTDCARRRSGDGDIHKTGQRGDSGRRRQRRRHVWGPGRDQQQPGAARHDCGGAPRCDARGLRTPCSG